MSPTAAPTGLSLVWLEPAAAVIIGHLLDAYLTSATLCNGVILDKTDDCNVQQLHKAKCTADLKTSAALDISTAAGSQSNQTLQLSLTDISISCVTDLEITGTVHATHGLGVLSKFPLKEIDVTKASVLWDM